jgi:hypothetical protein
VPFDNAAPVFMDYPIPMDFDYTVTASARINQHISQISGTLALGRLHPRFAQMTCPAGTVRRITVLGTTRANGMEVDKRLFRQVYRLRVSTEVEDPVAIATTRVAKVVLTVVARAGGAYRAGEQTTTTTAQTPDSTSSTSNGQYRSDTAGD